MLGPEEDSAVRVTRKSTTVFTDEGGALGITNVYRLLP